MSSPIQSPVLGPPSSTTAPASSSPLIKPRYWQWLQGVSPETLSLPWCHSTDAYALREILEAGMLAPQLCPVFGEELVYLFYGRPAYRRTEPTALAIGARNPVALIFAPGVAGKGFRLFPFDSGAFRDGLYTKWMHRNMKLEAFQLPPNLQAPERHVSALFKSNEAYMTVTAPAIDPMPPGEHEVECLSNFLRDRVAQPADDRRCALELQTREAIPLTDQHLLAIVIPHAMADAPYVREFQLRTADKVEILTYRSSPLKAAGELQGLLEDRVLEFCRERGML